MTNTEQTDYVAITRVLARATTVFGHRSAQGSLPLLQKFLVKYPLIAVALANTPPPEDYSGVTGDEIATATARIRDVAAALYSACPTTDEINSLFDLGPCNYKYFARWLGCVHIPTIQWRTRPTCARTLATVTLVLLAAIGLVSLCAALARARQ